MRTSPHADQLVAVRLRALAERPRGPRHLTVRCWAEACRSVWYKPRQDKATASTVPLYPPADAYSPPLADPLGHRLAGRHPRSGQIGGIARQRDEPGT